MNREDLWNLMEKTYVIQKEKWEYPVAGTYLQILQDLEQIENGKIKSKKEIKKQIYDIYNFLTQGDSCDYENSFSPNKYNEKCPIINEELREIVFNLLKKISPKYDVTKLKKIYNEYKQKIMKMIKEMFEEENIYLTDKELEVEIKKYDYNEILKYMENIIDILEHPEYIGLYELSQFSTIRQEVMWELNLLKKYAKKNWVTYPEEIEDVVKEILKNKIIT